jgi:uncharacterized membrane protein YbhN (UPF0104 family)
MLIESIETFFILGCLHSGLSFAAVLSFESFLSLARAVVFVLPAGLGVQDIGYVAFLDAVGVPGAASVGAAFVVAKRAKEAFWIAMGWSWLCLSRGRPSVIASAASPS